MVEHLPYTRGCFVCGIDNPHGLGLRFHAEADLVYSEFTPRLGHAGYPGVLHGGAIGAVLDEVMLWAASHRVGRMHMSVEVCVRYRGKVLVEEPHRVEARVVQVRGPMCKTEASLLDAAGEVRATATGKFLALPAEDVPRLLTDIVADPETADLDHYFSNPE